MIIKARKAKLDGVDLEDVVDLSINIGSSSSPSTASITFMGSKAEDIAETLTHNSLLEVGGIRFYGTEYSVSVSDGASGLTSTLEMIDQSFDILDRYYVELRISSHGATHSGYPSGDFLFLGSEYYTFARKEYKWNGAEKNWEHDQSVTVASSTVPRNDYEYTYNRIRKVYLSYKRALRNIEALSAISGGPQGSLSSTCDQEVEPDDILLLSGGQFAWAAQDILNFGSMPNPHTTKGEIFYKGRDVMRNPFGSNALFNATGSLRSVISSIAGQVGEAWYWDCTNDHSSSGGIKVAPDASSAKPYEARGHAYRKGMTRANSFSDGLITKRYIEGEVADDAVNSWIYTHTHASNSVFQTVIEGTNPVRDGLDLSYPGNDLLRQAIAYIELGQEVFKAIWIRLEGTINSTKFNALEQAKIEKMMIANNSQVASLIGGGFNRDGTQAVTGGGTHELGHFDESVYSDFITGSDFQNALKYARVWIAGGGPHTGASFTDEESARYIWTDYRTGVDPYVYEHSYMSGDERIFEYFPVSHEVVSSGNSCFIAGSPTIYYRDDLIKDTIFGQLISLVEANTACDTNELLDKSLEDGLGISGYIIVGDNSSWSYVFPPCRKETLQEWSKGAVVDFSTEFGNTEIGRNFKAYDEFSQHGAVAVKKMPTGFSSWEEVVGPLKDLITGGDNKIKSVVKMSTDSNANDSKYSEALGSRVCSSGKGKANWGIQVISSGAEVGNQTMDQINAFGSATCVDKTPFISYTLFGEWDELDDIGDLDSISVTYGSSGISTSYSRGYRKSITPSALLFSGYRSGSYINSINLGNNINRFSTKFKNISMSPQGHHVVNPGPMRTSKRPYG